MKNANAITMTLISLFAVAALTGAAQAAFMAENFNFGDPNGDGSTANLEGLGSAGGGWAGAWTHPGAQNQHYDPGTNLTLSQTGYTNDPDNAGTGAALGDSAGNEAIRLFDSAMTGDVVWVSAVVDQPGAGGDDTNVRIVSQIGGTQSNQNFVGARMGTGYRARLNDGDAGNDNNFGGTVSTGIHLLLGKFSMDVDGTNDQLEVWGDPDLSGGEAGLGTADVTASGVDIGDIIGIGVSIDGNNTFVDQIRVSDDANGFELVTAIPEPATLAVLGLGGLGVLLKRKRRES